MTKNNNPYGRSRYTSSHHLKVAVHREQSSPNRAINVSASQVVRMAQILTPDTSQVKGSSWSGKVPLTEDHIEELYQIGRTGALSFSFEDHSLVDYIA